MFFVNRATSLLGVAREGREVVRSVLFLIVLAVFVTGCAPLIKGLIKDVYLLKGEVLINIGYEAEKAEDRGDIEHLNALDKAEDEIGTACEAVHDIGYQTLLDKVVSNVLAVLAFFSLNQCESKAREIDGEFFQQLPPIQEDSIVENQ